MSVSIMILLTHPLHSRSKVGCLGSSLAFAMFAGNPSVFVRSIGSSIQRLRQFSMKRLQSPHLGFQRVRDFELQSIWDCCEQHRSHKESHKDLQVDIICFSLQASSFCWKGSCEDGRISASRLHARAKVRLLRESSLAENPGT
mmetsp:Transcript_20240/g.39555  ORF Transcript_20240/g.39555 Transcript_20240/m.39555 type:complete len:143 (-) Transcript_20240:137-565(-)